MTFKPFEGLKPTSGSFEVNRCSYLKNAQLWLGHKLGVIGFLPALALKKLSVRHKTLQRVLNP